MVDIHWADTTASKVIKEQGDKKKFVCASGVTPSGQGHKSDNGHTCNIHSGRDGYCDTKTWRYETLGPCCPC